MDARKATGKQIEIARRMKDWNQKQLADAYSTNQATISRMERGTIKIDFYDLSRLAEILGKPISFFYEPFDTPAVPSLEKHDKRGAGARDKPASPHHRAGKRSAA